MTLEQEVRLRCLEIVWRERRTSMNYRTACEEALVMAEFVLPMVNGEPIPPLKQPLYGAEAYFGAATEPIPSSDQQLGG